MEILQIKPSAQSGVYHLKAGSFAAAAVDPMFEDLIACSGEVLVTWRAFKDALAAARARRAG